MKFFLQLPIAKKLGYVDNISGGSLTASTSDSTKAIFGSIDFDKVSNQTYQNLSTK